MDGNRPPDGECGEGIDSCYAFWLGREPGGEGGDRSVQTSGEANILPESRRFTSIFDEAIRTITTERGSVYGHPKDDFNRAHRLTQVADECPHPEVRHALRMICVKVARLIQTPNHIDSIVDISG